MIAEESGRTIWQARVFIAALAMLSLGACGGGPGTRVSADDLLASIDSGHAPTVIDVRSDAEYEAGHLPGAVHVPFYAIWSRDSELPASRSEPVVVYCERGPRAAIARFGLQSLGFERVKDLDGHMAAWRAAGHPEVVGRR